MRSSLILTALSASMAFASPIHQKKAVVTDLVTEYVWVYVTKGLPLERPVHTHNAAVDTTSVVPVSISHTDFHLLRRGVLTSLPSDTSTSRHVKAPSLAPVSTPLSFWGRATSLWSSLVSQSSSHISSRAQSSSSTPVSLTSSQSLSSSIPASSSSSSSPSSSSLTDSASKIAITSTTSAVPVAPTAVAPVAPVAPVSSATSESPVVVASSSVASVQSSSVVATASTVPSSASGTCPDASSATDYISTVLYHHNIHRCNHSAPALTYNEEIAGYAATLAATCNFHHDLSVLPVSMAFLFADLSLGPLAV